ncbi:unnamed protein product [Acanthoscelides obtectus]|uniref:Major facilitator superfamily associated domain-containing protein n=2 Tax=Acanthoscelides obtectus TaxID=200917 RepID=A0A9P0K318_ACAOB|nr:unnamed protein product [Acanthoscelides obtectus]CAH1964460.1 unnamed protein product [Acanthoscelides obtectus]CAK1628774.1 Major facilitator superfamily domain-containing protein 6 [Acanthoscelides obtectus]CAK1628777.1 Major facilitator superfamily domain-containing protein 6 [Acanthoscelides obtectus]
MEKDTTADMEVNTDAEPKKSFFGFNKNLIMLKLTLFFLYGATSSLIPYLTIHMQSIGLTMEQIAWVYLALPFTTFLAPPATGYIVDKFGKYKPVVISSFLLTALLHHSLLFMPHQETPGTVPDGYIIRHPKKMYVEVWWSPCPSRECPDIEELDIVLDMCVDHCLLYEAKWLKQKKNNLTAAGVDVGDMDDLSFHIKKKKRNDTATALTLDMHPNLGDPVEQFGIELESAEEDEDVTEFKKRFRAGMLKKHGVDWEELEGKDLRCGGLVLQANVSTKDRLSNYTSDCILQRCQFRSGGPEVCPPDYKKSDESVFWIYFVLRFLGTTAMSAAVTIMDPIALTMIEKYGGDFGKERLFSSLGMATFSPLTGLLIDKTSERLGYTDYSAAFYAFDILLIFSSIALFMMPLGTKLPADNIFSDLLRIFKMPHLIVFILFLFILGNLWGFIESFLFFYLRDLGAPTFLLGITVTVGTISSIPFLYGAENITKKIGHVNVIIVAFFAQAVRLIGYSNIESAWWCFPFEAMEALSVHLMWVAAATYCTVLAPKNLLATLIGVCGMAHYSIGRGSGSFLGGNIIAKFGIRQSFKLMGYVAGFSGCAYAFLHCTWLKHVVIDDDYDNESKVKLKNGEPKYKDQSTMVSLERLTLMVEYNQIGSLTSLGRNHSIMRTRSSSIRRGSLGNNPVRTKSSNSKTDLLKSAIEITHGKASNTHLKMSNNHISKQNSKECVSSTPKLHQRSASLIPDKDLEKLIPNEKDEIIYDQIKKTESTHIEDETHNDEDKP